MGSTADERLEKRRMNELEDKLKSLQREMQSFKARTRKQVGKLRKDAKRSSELDDSMQEIFDQELALERAFEQIAGAKQKKETPEHNYKCRKDQCWSTEVHIVTAGIRSIVVCDTCKGRYTIETKDLPKSKT